MEPATLPDPSALTTPAAPPTRAERSASRWASRLAWAFMGAVSWTVIALSFWLQPSSRGFGTHEQLGLPPCTFQAMTHIPCPGCGLTTSFAHMAHLQPLRALERHPMGACLFLITLAVALVAPWAVRRAWPVHRALALPGTSYALGVTLAAGVATFAWRLITMR